MINYTEYIKNPYSVNENTLMCFDIEVSSFWVVNDKIYEYDYNKPDSFYNDADKGSVVYIWQFSIEDSIYYGRDLSEFEDFIDCLYDNIEKKVCYIYVHNLAYEFSFLRNLSGEFTNVFARMIRKPMKVTYRDKIEFRCSYQLTHLSLASWGKQNGINKKVGDLDYHILRTPKTALSDKELTYCEYDIKVMIVGLRKYIAKYKTIKKIPLTQTGEVRQVVKKMYANKKGYHNYISNLLPRSVNEYKIFKSVFGGGDTHANVSRVGIIYENVASFDETSAYPSMMIRKKFPMSPFIKTISRTFDFEKYCYIFCLEITNVELKGTITYLARSRCSVVTDGIYDNGRVVSAGSILLYCTELDYQGLHNHYTFNEKIISVRRANKGYLDTSYVKFILQLFKDKTTLKGVSGSEDLYMQQKQFLNSLYGLMVTDIIQPEIVFENNEWSAVPQIKRDYKSIIEELHTKKYKNDLSYAWGIYVTSYARYSLWRMIDAVTTNSDNISDIIYFDTDSCKFLNYAKHKHLFENENNLIREETIKALKHHKIDISEFEPVAPNGKKSSLGAWDFEGIYSQFITQGAKKYAYIEDGEIHITVSGVPKKAGKSLKSLDDFKDGYVFSALDCAKGLSTYLDGNNYEGYLPDGYNLHQPYGLNIRDVGYTLGLTADFKNIISIMRLRGEI